MTLPAGAEEANRRALVGGAPRAERDPRELLEERISRNEAAAQQVALVRGLGLRAVLAEELPEEIGTEDLGVVCWMAVLGPA